MVVENMIGEENARRGDDFSEPATPARSHRSKYKVAFLPKMVTAARAPSRKAALGLAPVYPPSPFLWTGTWSR